MIDLDLIINEIKHNEDLELIELDMEDLLTLDNDILESIIPDLDDDTLDFLEKMQEGGLLPELKMSGRTSSQRKQAAKKNYRRNKAKILINRKKLRKTGKAKVVKKKRKIMAKGSKTLTGKRKVKYHV